MGAATADGASVLFSWKREDFDALLRSCDHDEASPFLLRALPRDGKILEVGCGLGRFVKYMRDRGFDCDGIEGNPDTVRAVAELCPGLPVLHGDALRLPHGDGTVAGVISLGVVEHFPAGLGAPLRELRRVLRPGGRGVITVPSLNRLRRAKRALLLEEALFLANPRNLLRHSRLARRALGKPPLDEELTWNRRRPGPHAIHPPFGPFFEYRLRPEEFEAELRGAGFRILESRPICHLDGVYLEFGRALVGFRGWTFHPNAAGRALDRALRRWPFTHNHMHLCVVEPETA